MTARQYAHFSQRNIFGHEWILSVRTHGQVWEDRQTKDDPEAKIIGKHPDEEMDGAQGKEIAEWVRVRALPERGERRTGGEQMKENGRPRHEGRNWGTGVRRGRFAGA